MWPILLAVIAVLVGAFWLKVKCKAAGLPPGPRGWPLVGVAFQVDGKHPQHTFTDWCNQFGGICTAWFFQEPVIMISTPEYIQEALVTKSKEFGNRAPMFKWNYFLQGNTDIILANFSKEWSIRKKIATNTMKMYGDGLRKLEVITVDTVNDLNKYMLSTGEPFDPKEELVYAATTIIGSLVINSANLKIKSSIQ